jgi:hypothetical protein
VKLRAERRSGEEADNRVENKKEITINEVIEEEENRGRGRADSDNADGIARQSEDPAIADSIKDYCELTKSTAEQEWLIEELYKSLESGGNEEKQTQNIMAVFMSIILQSLNGLDRFNSPIVHFAAVLGIVENKKRLYRRNKYSYMLAGFIYCVRVLFIEHTLPVATQAEQTAEDIDQFFELYKKFLVVESYSLCSFLIKMLGYGKTMSIQKIN